MLQRLTGLFSSLKRSDVRYVVIGGIAAVLHGVPRATFDVDILIEATRGNVERLLAALEGAGLATALLTDPDAILANEVTIFRDRVRVDVQTRTPGLDFQDAWRDRVVMEYGGTEFYVASREHLIASKLAAGRTVDREDVRMLCAETEEE